MPHGLKTDVLTSFFFSSFLSLSVSLHSLSFTGTTHLYVMTILEQNFCFVFFINFGATFNVTVIKYVHTVHLTPIREERKRKKLATKNMIEADIHRKKNAAASVLSNVFNMKKKKEKH